MKILRIILLVLVVVVVIAVLGGLYIFNDWTRGPLPQQSGEITITAASAQAAGSSSLTDSVEIIRDEYGVPHIYASNTHDLFWAQGYTHAQDRWWQMEFSRHIGNGTIQELTGKTDSLIGTDVFIRKAGWRRAAERDLASYTEEEIALLQAFADGVNTYIMNRDKGDLALEYTLLGLTGVNITIEPWTPADTLVWTKVMADNLSGNWGEELDRSDLYAQLGQEMTDEYVRPWPFGYKPTILQAEDLPISEDTLTTAQATHIDGVVGVDSTFANDYRSTMATMFGEGAGIGSNNWVISGKKTASGMPLLANDPHLSIQMPSIWYEVGLHCTTVDDSCPFDVVGFAFPAAPGVVIGHNANIAWGVTNVGPDTQDLYMIKVNPDNDLQYEWNGEWRDMTVYDEVINFGDGEPPMTIQVRETHLGPIINDNSIDPDTHLPSGFNNTDPMALRWTAYESGTIFRALIMLDQASNWEEFREAASWWDSPAQNIIYADVEGNIGYQTPGMIPIRAAGHSGLLPVPGWTDEYEWLGYIPFDDMPRILNPERGYIATANQAVVPLEYYDQLRDKLADQFGADSNYFIGQEWAYGYRAQRIVEMLEASDQHTAETIQAIQGDNKMISAEELMPYLEAVKFDTEDLTNARAWLLEWDYQLDMDSPQAALYGFFWVNLLNDLYNDQLGDVMNATTRDLSMWATYELAQDPENAWWDDINTPDVVETRDDILVRAFAEGYQAATDALGADRDKWRWGDVHTATFVSNPLGLSGIDLIENIVNRGPVATSGGSDAVNATGFRGVNNDFTVQALPSMRMIVDLSDLTQSLSIHTTGQSGHPYSEHYGDFIDLWRNIQYHPMLWSREQVQAAGAQTLVLKPGS
ncbi:MAG: penicillin acylase family protein [Anaerolineaceae bacterium]|nr:penicillin acylase family protein [Anaerolineaceae bacterium]